MHVLLTGASSFTGLAIVEALVAAGIEVTATCRRRLDAYQGQARRRLGRVHALARLVEGVTFGDPGFVDLILASGPFEVLGHHGAEVGDFRRPGFDPMRAAAANAANADGVMRALAASGGRALLVTGTVFEADEGGGGAVDAYGLSKTLAWHLLRHQAERHGLVVGKLVIPHPFGLYDKPGLVQSLIRSWLAYDSVILRQPQLRRDFIHGDLVGAVYARLCQELQARSTPRHLRPSLYRESVATFARRLAAEMRPRLGRPCAFSQSNPAEPSAEPLERFNSDPIDALLPGCDPGRSWDRLAEHCLTRSGES